MTDQPLTLLGELLEAARGGTSKRQAAKDAGISEARWRQIVTGRQRQSGMNVPVNPKRDTVIAMAEAVNADVNEALRRAGYEPIPNQPVIHVDETTVDVKHAIEQDQQLTDEAREHLLSQYEMLRRLSEHDGRKGGRPLRAVARKRPGGQR